MVLGRAFSSWFGFSLRFGRALAAALLFSVVLAAAYVWRGVELNGAANFASVDAYAFSIALLSGLVLVGLYFVQSGSVAESLAVASTLAWALLFGLEDLLVYALHPDPLPAELPWLMDSVFIGGPAGFLGFDTVTSGFLIGWVAVTGMVLVYLWKLAYHRF